VPFRIDGALYPDEPALDRLDTLADRIDFLARLCAAWDFGRLPDAETAVELKRPEWREAVDRTRLLTSPAYHLLRRWHALPTCPYLGQPIPHVAGDPNLDYV
jgi:hypothetical protein